MQTFEKRHGMFFEQDRCILCNSEDIFKVPSIQTQARNTSTQNKKPGKIVDKYIEDTKKEIKKEKRRLASEEI
tara:strand:+ start:283 stop:501 length:219 start_codon:yes stop_codon:yes gene_type:complete